MNKEEIRQYLKNNLKVKCDLESRLDSPFFASANKVSVKVSILLEGEVVAQATGSIRVNHVV